MDQHPELPKGEAPLQGAPPVPQPAQPQAEAWPPTQPGYRQCHHCKNLVAAGDPFCRFCGKKAPVLKPVNRAPLVVVSVLLGLSLLCNLVLFSVLSPALRKASFVDRTIAFIPVEEKTYYHTYDCALFINAKSFTAYDVSIASHMGFAPCPLCH